MNGQLEGNSKRQRSDQSANASAMPVCDDQRLQTKATGGRWKSVRGSVCAPDLGSWRYLQLVVDASPVLLQLDPRRSRTRMDVRSIEGPLDSGFSAAVGPIMSCGRVWPFRLNGRVYEVAPTLVEPLVVCRRSQWPSTGLENARKSASTSPTPSMPTFTDHELPRQAICPSKELIFSSTGVKISWLGS